MGDVVLSPMTVSPPPSPSPSPSNRSNLPMLYYGLVVVGTAAIVLTIYNLIITKGCSRGHTHVMQSQPAGPNPNGSVMSSSRSFENSQRNLLSSFKYKREEGERGGEGGDEHECPVCLSAFEEGEEVRKLPRCKHSFHAECIDMWLYSHFDCPICRTPVGPFRHRFPVENSNSGGAYV